MRRQVDWVEEPKRKWKVAVPATAKRRQRKRAVSMTALGIIFICDFWLFLFQEILGEKFQCVGERLGGMGFFYFFQGKFYESVLVW